ncbi:MAG: sigma 54-interacting transcriptional regulator [Deltaproteobacteria bacterium]|nr:sigma 54-interacting transcriptional regulator [Deltaproteobacteria bacterium]
MSAPKRGDRDAFVVIRHGDQTRVVDLPPGETVVVGHADDADISLDDPQLHPKQLSFERQGEQIMVKSLADGTFVGGKPLGASMLVGPGEEISASTVRMVVGVARPLNGTGRRALTHHELRERLYEELSRAGRGGRPTALVMLSGPNPGDGQTITSAALDAFRAGDVVATYAPDQVEFLLPDIDEATARLVVERVLEGAEVEAQVGLAIAPHHGESPERLIRAAREALAEAQRTEVTIATPPPRVPRAVEQTVVDAHDPVTRELLAEVDAQADGRDPVLLLGERSAGKSAIARLLHVRGGREGPFVSVACTTLEGDTAKAALSTQITDATGGTLMLDEVGELDQASQAALMGQLDVLASANVRLIATTHRTLAGLVSRGGFDEKLYQRLSTIRLEVPSLRSRPDDILPLATSFARQAGAEEVKLSPGAVARLRSYPWPGNVLELSNAMARAVVLARGGEVLAEHLPSEPVTIASGEGRLREHVDSVERDSIIKALADCNHNQTHAAKRLGISRRALIYKMEKYGLKRPPKGSRKR